MSSIVLSNKAQFENLFEDDEIFLISSGNRQISE
jgi:hypothetical protein